MTKHSKAASEAAAGSGERTSRTDDLRIENVTPLPPPEHLIRFFPIAGTPVERQIGETRGAIRRIMQRDDDRLLAAGEVVVVGARGDPGRLGDVVDPNVLRAVFAGQAQRGGTQGLPGRALLALAQAAVAGAHASHPTEKCVRA